MYQIFILKKTNLKDADFLFYIQVSLIKKHYKVMKSLKKSIKTQQTENKPEKANKG